MSEQEIFDTVLQKIREQGKPSIYCGGCAYRGPDGLKCAAGHLIPDEDYTKEFEEGTVGKCFLEETAGNEESFLVTNYFNDKGYDLNFISELQQAHDLNYKAESFVEHFNASMRKVANKYKLEYSEV